MRAYWRCSQHRSLLSPKSNWCGGNKKIHIQLANNLIKSNLLRIDVYHHLIEK
jgi:hypothetical protein